MNKTKGLFKTEIVIVENGDADMVCLSVAHLDRL